ncbi:MAG TPA: putative glycoside hydrolase, partial [Candidatus Limnocylindria bacterium]|nr:putative glycoside hydrolase [Candidatus Limnocylindria bacterium]
MTPLRAALAAIGLATLLAGCGQAPVPLVPTPAPTPTPTPEGPRQLTVLAVERGTDRPIPGARVEVDGNAIVADARGAATITAMRGSPVRVAAEGFDPGASRVPAEGQLVVELRSNVVGGIVTDGAGAPLAGVRVFVEGSETLVRTDAAGRYELRGVPEGATIIYKRAGHRLGAIPLGERTTLDVALPRFEVRALYAPAAIFETPGRLDALLALLDRTEANALVIDVKETEGQLYYATELPAAVEAGAVREPIFRLEELLPRLRERGIYTIARMVVMKDNTLAAARPELAVMNAATGEPWRDNIGGVWLDPAAPGVAEYAAAIAGDLADKGFDEVQLDYIRFFSDGPYEVADTNLPNLQSFRLPALRHVLRVIHDRLETSRAFLAADVFPIPFIVPDDQGIGQRADSVMPYLDYVCPMSYPSHYGPGVFGFDVPNEHPYDVVA